MTIGAKIWALRRAMKLSRRKVAEAGGFSMDSLRRWELEQQSPRVDELERLAEVLGVPVGEVLG